MKAVAWPSQPYKGLSYYTHDDAPLFSGRDEDAHRCARFLADCRTRILILHGSTGCGKSSFLRAGLIPFLESGDVGFRFVRSAEEEQSKAIFVRSTDAPLCRLSECLFEFISRPLTNMTPHGPQTIDLREKIVNYPDCNSFCNNVAINLEEMLTVLHKLARTIPQTLALIIDQAEEVLTLNPGPDGQDSRDHFFDFLTRFHEMQLDMKLLIALRTEYSGRFDNEIQNRMGDIVTIPHYLLTDLTENRMVEAIERPTQKDTGEFGEYGSPYSNYKFSYEKGLPQKIAEDLSKANPRGGVLPVLQIVCERLHQSITNRREQPDREMVITTDDYMRLGGIEGQVEAYISELIARFCAQNGISRGITNEIERWKHVLYLLTKEQLDGTVTTDIKSVDKLKTEAEKQFCELDFDQTMKYLSDEEQRVIRREEITNIENKQRIACYSLGHDAIGLALHKWKIKQEDSQIYNKRTMQALRTFGRYFALVCGIICALFTISFLIFIPLLLTQPLWGEASEYTTKLLEPERLGIYGICIVFYASCSFWFFRRSGFMPRIQQVIGGFRRRWFRKRHSR